MDEIFLTRFLHVVGFAYWLGTDLGVFYSSYFVTDSRRSPEARVATAKILFALDQAPRICMTLMLPLGVHLAWSLGLLRVDGGLVALVWLVCLAWLANVIYLYRAGPGRRKTLFTRVDFWFRVLLVGDLLVVGLAGLNRVGLSMPDWLAWKFIIFAGLVACGLVVRVRLREFAPAFANLAAGRPDEADNEAIRRSLGGTRPFVIAIWAGLLVSTALGLRLI